VSLQALAVFVQAASAKEAEAGRALGQLVALVERQPDDFQLVWEWSTLRTFLAESKDPAIVARRESLSKPLDALEPGRDRKARLARLKSLSGEFPRAAVEAAKRPETACIRHANRIVGARGASVRRGRCRF
jgi:hypothetical protein